MTIEECLVMQRKERSKRHREKMKKEGRCLYCGKEDSFTMVGRIRCAECSEKQNARAKEYRKDKDWLDKERIAHTQRKNRLIAEGRCHQCGRINVSKYKYCQYCRAKDKRRKDKIRDGKSFTRGTVLCWQCNKEEPIEGKKLCAACYERALRNIEIANKARMKRKIYPYWSGKNIVDKRENV